MHGASLREKHRALLRNADVLLDLVRRLLRGFITLAASSGHPYSKTWFGNELDAALLAGESRAALREAMNLPSSS